MSLNHMCFVWLKTSSFNAFGELWIMKSSMKHKVMKLEIVNKKITLQVQSFKLNLAMVSKTCLGSLDHTSLSLSKNQQKKRFKSCLQPLIKLGKTMQQPLHASKMKKIEKLRPLHKLKETLSKCSLCLPKCKLTIM